MARSVHGVGLALAIVAVVAATVATPCAAQTRARPAPLALPSCPAAPISLSPCIGYVFGVGSATLSSCCSELRTFFLAQGPCLCAASKLTAAGPFGLLLGQAQVLKPLIPNVCNLPSNPCDDVASKSSEPSSTTTPLAPALMAPAAAPDTPAMTPSEEPDEPEESEAPAVPVDDSPATVTAPGQVVPGDAGSSAGGSQVGAKLPELLHSAGVLSSRNTGAGAVLITLFLAYVSAMYM